MPNRFMTAAATLVVLSAPCAWAKDNLSIGIVTFSTSDIHTNQMVDTMTAEAKSKDGLRLDWLGRRPAGGG